MQGNFKQEFQMKHYYVVQVYSGYETATKDDIERRIAKSSFQDSFGEILVPSTKFKASLTTEEIKNEQLFPGYILVEMILTPETMKLVTSSIRVLKFVGGLNPKPLKQEEAELVKSQMRGEVSIRHEQTEFNVGGQVQIQDGPFSGFDGIISAVDSEHEKLTVMVSIFGRMTPVELEFGQVK